MAHDGELDDKEMPKCKTFRLLALPTELWLYICELAITSPDPIQLNRTSKHPSVSPEQRVAAQPALTKVNKLLRKEALPLYYQNNDFTFVFRPHDLVLWAHAVGKDKAGMARSLSLDTGLFTASRVECSLLASSKEISEANGVEEGMEFEVTAVGVSKLGVFGTLYSVRVR